MFEPRISGLVEMYSLTWWRINFSCMILRSLPRWVVFPSGPTPCCTECRTNVTEMRKIVQVKHTISGRCRSMSWTDEMIPPLMRDYLDVILCPLVLISMTGISLAEWFVITSIVIIKQTKLLSVLASIHHGFRYNV